MNDIGHAHVQVRGEIVRDSLTVFCSDDVDVALLLAGDAVNDVFKFRQIEIRPHALDILFVELNRVRQHTRDGLLMMDGEK